LESQQRFANKRSKYNINRNTTEEELTEILKANKYIAYNKAWIDTPQFVRDNEELKQHILLEKYGASYDYLVLMNIRSFTKKAYDTRQKKLDDLREYYAMLCDEDDETFRGSKIWLKELDILEKSIKDGVKSQWFYGENDVKYA